MTTEEFKTELEYKLIPAIERMIQKEDDHLSWLLAKRDEGAPQCINEMIGTSKFILQHLKTRLQEYETYKSSQP